MQPAAGPEPTELVSSPVLQAGIIGMMVDATVQLRAEKWPEEQAGIKVLDAAEVQGLTVYIDGADEIDGRGCMIKGGGAALTREKIVADLAERFVCIADESKLVRVLGNFPLPVEVIPMARSYVARELVKLGGQPALRQGFTTDNGNVILDVHNMSILNPPELEATINQITGVVTNGLFARRGADVLLLGTADGVQTMTR